MPRGAVERPYSDVFVQVGDQLEEFGPVCEVQSDKANVEITSPYTGLVQKLYGDVGDMIQVREPAVLCFKGHQILSVATIRW